KMSFAARCWYRPMGIANAKWCVAASNCVGMKEWWWRSACQLMPRQIRVHPKLRPRRFPARIHRCSRAGAGNEGRRICHRERSIRAIAEFACMLFHRRMGAPHYWHSIKAALLALDQEREMKLSKSHEPSTTRVYDHHRGYGRPRSY